MKYKLTVIVIALIITVFIPKPAMACWIKLSTTQELVQESDVILIGEIVGPANEGKIKSEGLSESWITNWNVKVYYYLKGEPELKDFVVTTPGAENKGIITSVDYRLDQWGNTVLLFLRQRDGLYEPLSPQGVINLKKNKSPQKTDKPLDGQLILGEFEFSDTKISSDERKELEKFIVENNYYISPIEEAGTMSLIPEPLNPTIIILAIIILAFTAVGIRLNR